WCSFKTGKYDSSALKACIRSANSTPSTSTSRYSPIFGEFEVLASAVRGSVINLCSIFDLVEFVNAVVSNVDQPAVAALFIIPAPLGRYPFAFGNVMIFTLAHRALMPRGTMSTFPCPLQRLLALPSAT